MIAKTSRKRFCSRTCINRYRQWHKRGGAIIAAQRANLTCEHCGEQFTAKRTGRRFCSPKCQHRAYCLRNKEQYAEWARSHRRKYPKAGMSYRHRRDWDELFDELWNLQDGKCYLCGVCLDRDKPRGVTLDHDHACCPYGYSCELCRRGLTCPRCNNLIGLADEDPDRLRRIADNLERVAEVVRQRKAAAAA